MKLKKQNGYVIELMIVFMLVTFAFCMVVTTFVYSLAAKKKASKGEIDSQTALNQVGEYYLRCVESGGIFPKNITVGATDTQITTYKGKNQNDTVTNLSSYQNMVNNGLSWLNDNGDTAFNNSDETVQFFKKYNTYTYEDQMYVQYGDIFDFFVAKSVKRRLIVKSGTGNNAKIKMILTVEEKYQNNNESPSNCEILSWCMGDNLDNPADSGDFKQTKLSTLEKIWKFFGLTAKDIKNMERSNTNIWLVDKIKDIYGFTSITVNNWREIIFDY